MKEIKFHTEEKYETKRTCKKLENAGFIFERHGSNHDVYAKGDEKEEVPRHKEIDERLARAIIKRRNL